MNKKFISFLDPKGKLIEGYFELVSENDVYLQIKTAGGNILTIPWHRVLRIKDVSEKQINHNKERKKNG